MHPVSNRSARFNEIAKAHTSDYPRDITTENIKFWPTIYQTGAYTINAAQVISNYLKLQCENAYTITDTNRFSQELSTSPPWKRRWRECFIWNKISVYYPFQSKKQQIAS